MILRPLTKISKMGYCSKFKNFCESHNIFLMSYYKINTAFQQENDLSLTFYLSISKTNSKFFDTCADDSKFFASNKYRIKAAEDI